MMTGVPTILPHYYDLMESDDYVFLWNTFSALNSACTVPLSLESI